MAYVLYRQSEYATDERLTVSMPLITVACHEDLSASDLVGRYLLAGEETVWIDGPLTRAVCTGAICYLDEIVEARKDTTVLIHALTDHRRILPVEKRSVILNAHENFLLVLSYNPGYQSVLKDLKPSTRQRFVSLEFDYPPHDHETRIIAHESGVDPDIAADLATLGVKVRHLRHHSFEEGVSTRLLVYAGQLIARESMHDAPVMSPFVGPLRTTQTCNGPWLNSLQRFSPDVPHHVTGSPRSAPGHLRPTGHDVLSRGTTLRRSRPGGTARVHAGRVCYLDPARSAASAERLAGRESVDVFLQLSPFLQRRLSANDLWTWAEHGVVLARETGEVATAFFHAAKPLLQEASHTVFAPWVAGSHAYLEPPPLLALAAEYFLVSVRISMGIMLCR